MGERQVPLPVGEDKLKYYRIPINLYKNGDLVEQDIYLRYQGNYLVYRAKSTRWSSEDSVRLEEFGSDKELYIRCETDNQHFKFIESNLTRVMSQKDTPTKEKAVFLYQCATGIAEGVFKNPSSSETLVRSKKVVTHTMEHLAKDSSAFMEMISLSSHDYYTYTHCVNVMTFTISLLNALGQKDKKVLEDAAIGAFLHDIGKAKVPLTVLNKPGPLTADEWKIMKKHPEYGMDLLGDKQVPERGKEIILQHHEKINGVGYPFGLRGNQIPLISQVVSICDAYDAMTTNRCYQRARSGFEAFRIITHEMKGHFSPRLVETFIELMNFRKKN
ncbi:MAG: metal dependent phosphohydrolase [Bacteriovoracaceae bacterium]|nr:metal dependent phosphohydrolase [Bacteriovoracaceae bacterium]